LAQAVKLEPSSYNCFWYAKALDGLRETTEALQMVKRALSYDSKDYATAWLMVNLQRQLRDYEAALVTCDALLVDHMGEAQLAYTKAMLRLQMNQPEVALELLRAVAREDLPLLYLRLRCRLLYQTGDYQAALEDCLGALKHEPNHPISLELQGQILVAMGRGVKAIGVYRKLLALRPDLFWVRINLGLLLLEARQYGSAQEMFAIGLIDRPEDGDLLYLQAFSLLELNRWEEARVVLEKLMVVMPEHELGRRVYESLI
jgi:tetratricopeptide (TPR) repeat protein